MWNRAPGGRRMCGVALVAAVTLSAWSPVPAASAQGQPGFEAEPVFLAPDI